MRRSSVQSVFASNRTALSRPKRRPHWAGTVRGVGAGLADRGWPLDRALGAISEGISLPLSALEIVMQFSNPTIRERSRSLAQALLPLVIIRSINERTASDRSLPGTSDSVSNSPLPNPHKSYLVQ